MFVTYPSYQITRPRNYYYQDDAVVWSAVMFQSQEGWFTTTISYSERPITETILNPYPSGICTIANHIKINKLSVSCIQSALFNKQLNSWTFHEVEEIWCWQEDSSSEDFEFFFRLEGGRGLLDSAGNPAPIEQGDKLELVYLHSLTAES